MNIDHYAAELLSVLRDHTDDAVHALRQLDRRLPEGARGLCIMVHVPQDPDGTFSVIAHLDGPDLHVLNKEVADVRTLLDVRVINGVVTPDVPVFDRRNTPFEINDVIVDTAMLWLNEVWVSFGGTTRKLPVILQGEEGYGTKDAVFLEQ